MQRMVETLAEVNPSSQPATRTKPTDPMPKPTRPAVQYPCVEANTVPSMLNQYEKVVSRVDPVKTKTCVSVRLAHKQAVRSGSCARSTADASYSLESHKNRSKENPASRRKRNQLPSWPADSLETHPAAISVSDTVLLWRDLALEHGGRARLLAQAHERDFGGVFFGVVDVLPVVPVARGDVLALHGDGAGPGSAAAWQARSV